MAHRDEVELGLAQMAATRKTREAILGMDHRQIEALVAYVRELSAQNPVKEQMK